MRTAFKVATAFTGAAACAAAFTPAAEAAPTTTATAAARTQLMMPDTAHHNCTVGPATTSAVFYWPASKHHGPTCVGGLPNLHVRTSLGGTDFSKMCAGNNSGYFFVHTLNSPMGFTRGTTKNILGFQVSQVSISQWHGGIRAPRNGFSQAVTAIAMFISATAVTARQLTAIQLGCPEI